MTKFWYLAGFATLILAASAQAGRPVIEKKICPVGGEEFETTGTMSCTSFGGSQDFLLKPQTSCDFVTKLPQCPTNKLPLYKEFDAAEIQKLEGFVKTDEYKGLQNRSRYMIAQHVEKFLQGGNDAKGLGFNMLFGGLQFDRENTLADTEYLSAVKIAGEEELKKEENENTPYIQLIMSYFDYFQGAFEAATTRLGLIQVDEKSTKNEFITGYIARLSDCVKSSDSKKCASTDQVVPNKPR